MNKEERKIYLREWKKNNRERCLLYQRRYRINLKEEDPEKFKQVFARREEINRKSYLKHKTKNLEKARLKHLVLKNGKKLYNVNKRPRIGFCEMCDKLIPPPKRLVWHHWDDNKPELGMWLCMLCHYIVEGVERGIHQKYLILKEKIINGDLNTKLCFGSERQETLQENT